MWWKGGVSPSTSVTWLTEVYSLERVHSEGDVHAGAVREEGGQGGLLKQSKDQDLVPGTHRGTIKMRERNQRAKQTYLRKAENKTWTLSSSSSQGEDFQAQNKHRGQPEFLGKRRRRDIRDDADVFVLTSCPVGRQSSSWSYR